MKECKFQKASAAANSWENRWHLAQIRSLERGTRQENWISLAGDDGDFGTGPDTVSPRSRA